MVNEKINSIISPYKKHVRLIVLLLVVIFLFIRCVPEGKFIITGDELNLQIDSKVHVSADSTIEIYETEYTFPLEVNINNLWYNEIENVIILNYTESGLTKYMAFKADENKSLWIANSDMTYVLDSEDNLIVQDLKNQKLHDLKSGKFIRITEPYIFLIGEGKSILFSPDSVALLNTRDGKRIWKGIGYEWQGFREQYQDQNWYYVIAEGIHAIESDEGKKWEYLTPTSFTDVGKEMAKQIGLSCLAALAGGYSTSSYNPDVTQNMNSQPVFNDDFLYFAAIDKVVCLDKYSGKLIWETKIDEELEGLLLYDISDKELALIGTGKKIVNFYYQKSYPPSIRIINKESGKVTNHLSCENEAIQLDFDYYGKDYFLLTPAQLFFYNEDLKVIGILETNKEYGDFLDIISVGDTVIIRSSKGLLGISKENYSESWFQYCEQIYTKETEEWIKPFLERNEIQKNSVIQYGLYWTPNENKELIAYDLKNGDEIMKIKLLGDQHKISDFNYFLDYDKNKIKFLRFE